MAAYRLLELRYVEAVDPAAVQEQLGIARSHYYREQECALAAVTALLSPAMPPPNGESTDASTADNFAGSPLQVGRPAIASTNEEPPTARAKGNAVQPTHVGVSARGVDALLRSLTTFVGRERELPSLRERLRQPPTRLAAAGAETGTRAKALREFDGDIRATGNHYASRHQAARTLAAARGRQLLLQNCCDMIPPFDPSTGLLPAGVHEATWEELVARFGWTPRRLTLLAGLKAALDALRIAGCRRAYIDGSFVTAKETPGDFGGCWEVAGVELARLDPVLKTFANLRAAQKRTYGGELFPADAPADLDGTNFLRFFQRDRLTRAAKGIVAIDLGGLP